MGHLITLESTTPIAAWLAEPVGPSKGGVVVIQEIFGINSHIREVTDRLAAAGYTAIAPAVFDSVEAGVELGYDQQSMIRGIALMNQVGFERPLQDIAAAARRIAGAGKVGTVGFCWGGTLAYASAIRLGLPGVSYYGGGNTHFVSEQATAPLMFHYGELDDHISAEDRAKVHAANPDAPLYVYPAAHGFNCDQRGSFNADSAKLAWERTLSFLAAQLS